MASSTSYTGTSVLTSASGGNNLVDGSTAATSAEALQTEMMGGIATAVSASTSTTTVTNTSASASSSSSTTMTSTNSAVPPTTTASSGVSDAKLKRFLEHNQRLKEQLDMRRISVSEAGQCLIKYVTNTKDSLLPMLWGNPTSDPFSKQTKACCTIS
ncbi:hypothetical protein BGZ94_008217 [Podila epigama]|nr:hypothetical protein BGZ94_008217 [Podila epigama]